MTNKKIQQPNFKQLPVNKLIIEKYYQRKLSIGRVKKIVREYNPHLMKPIRVSVRDGKFYVFDGQHRLQALKILKETYVMCEVHQDLKFEDEAWLFAHQNDNEVDVSPIYKFHALVQSEDKDAVLINKVLLSHGLEISPGGGKNKIQAVNGLFDVYKEFGIEILNRTFQILKLAWDGDSISLQKPFIHGLALFLKNNSEADLQWLAKNLSKISAIKFKSDGDSTKNSFKSPAKSYEHHYRLAYEFRRRKENIS